MNEKTNVNYDVLQGSKVTGYQTLLTYLNWIFCGIEISVLSILNFGLYLIFDWFCNNFVK